MSAISLHATSVSVPESGRRINGEVYLRRAATPYAVLRYLLSFVLLVAGSLKLLAAEESWAANTAMDPSAVTGSCVALVEIFLAFWAMLGVYPRALWLALGGCFITFTAVSAMYVHQGLASCGCFGRFEVNPKYAMEIDIAALVGLAVLSPVPWSRAGLSKMKWAIGGRGAAVLCCAILFASAAIAKGGSAWRAAHGVRLADQAPEQWVGKRLPLIDAIDGPGIALDRGQWIVLLYRNGCPKCINELRRYEMMANEPETRRAQVRIAVVEVPPFAPAGQSAVPPDTKCVKCLLRDASRWQYRTPTAFILDDGYVTYLAGLESR